MLYGVEMGKRHSFLCVQFSSYVKYFGWDKKKFREFRFL